MLTLEMAEELVEYAEQNNIPFIFLISPFIAFIAISIIMIIFTILLCSKMVG